MDGLVIAFVAIQAVALAIACHIVEGHGGTIRVESEEGRGARFAFTVSVSDAPHATEPTPIPSGAAHA